MKTIVVWLNGFSSFLFRWLKRIFKMTYSVNGVPKWTPFHPFLVTLDQYYKNSFVVFYLNKEKSTLDQINGERTRLENIKRQNLGNWLPFQWKPSNLHADASTVRFKTTGLLCKLMFKNPYNFSKCKIMCLYLLGLN